MKSRSHRFIAGFAAFCALLGLFALFLHQFPGSDVVMQKMKGQATVADRLREFGPRADLRWQPFFERAAVPYPPQKLIFLGLKQEKRLEIYAQDQGKWHFIRALPILRASGKIGPKLREGDLQVPEGFYKIEGLNPNSAFHLSLRISYPSAFDREIAGRQGRTELGGDIMIHGSNASVGCLAMGDEAAEDLFVLAAQAGRENIAVWLCPLDFRDSEPPVDSQRPAWVENLYTQLRKSVQALPREPG